MVLQCARARALNGSKNSKSDRYTFLSQRNVVSIHAVCWSNSYIMVETEANIREYTCNRA